MAKKNSVNPLLVGLGLAVGTAGALFFSKKENRTKAKKAIKTVKNSGGTWLAEAAREMQRMAKDVDALSTQKNLDSDKPKRRTVKKK